MTVHEAVVQRLLQLCAHHNISVNHLCNISDIAPSTVHSFLHSKSQNTRIETIRKLCNGLNISLVDFFNSDLFDNLEQEVK